jgi:hypothetical protein
MGKEPYHRKQNQLREIAEIILKRRIDRTDFITLLRKHYGLRDESELFRKFLMAFDKQRAGGGKALAQGTSGQT